MENNKLNKYFAFISYKRDDEEWAIWFQHEMENYHLPVSLNGREDLPDNFRPVFRDVDELKAGNLPKQIYEALSSSTFLIVICSPHSAKSEWVNKEIMDFIEIGKNKGIDNVQNIFPFIVEGTPHAKNNAEECFPDALRNLSDVDERIGGNVNEGVHKGTSDVNDIGRDKAFVKVLAGMLPKVSFDDLWNRYEHDKAEKERLKREERDRFLCMQSRFMAEKIIDLSYDTSLAQLLALEVLPKDLENPDRPFTVEAEHALRQASSLHNIMLHGHALNINDFSFSSDGKRLVSISDDSTIRLWDAELGTLIWTIKHGRMFANLVVITPDASMVIAAFGEGLLVAWDVETCNAKWEIELKSFFDLEYDIFPVSMAISPDGKKLVISSTEGDVYIIDFEKEETSSVKLDSCVVSLEFCRDGKMLVAASFSGFTIWDFENDCQSQNDVDEEAADIIDNVYATFSTDGKRVAFFVGSPIFSQIFVYDIETDSQIQTFKKEYDFKLGSAETKGSIVYISFCDKDESILSVSNDGEVKIWDIKTGQEIECCNLLVSKVNKAIFNASSNYIAMIVNQNNILVRGLRYIHVEKTILTKEDSKLGTIAYSPDGKYILAGTLLYEKGDLAIWDVNSGQMVCELVGHTDRIWSASYSQNGKHILSASYDGTVRVWNSQTGEIIRILDAVDAVDEETAFTSAAFSPDGTQVVAATYNGYIVIWDIVSGLIIRKFRHSINQVWSVAYSPDGAIIVSASLDRDLKEWDSKTGTLICTLVGHTKNVTKCIFSPNGKYIASASEDNSIIIWNANAGSKARTLGMSSQNANQNMDDNNECSAANQLLNYANFLGMMGGEKTVHKTIKSISFSPDSRFIASVSSEGEMMVWDVVFGMNLVTYSGYKDTINRAVFSPDGCHIASASNDGIIRIWDFIPLQELIEQTRERLKKRSLSPEERQQYYLE